MRQTLIIIVSLLFISGCYDYRELNDMSVVTGIGIDYKDDMYVVSLEVTKSIKDGSSNEIETVIYSGSNKVLADAFLEAKNMSDKNFAIAFAHIFADFKFEIFIFFYHLQSLSLLRS